MNTFKKLCPIFGILLGIAIAISGVLVLSGELGGDSYSAHSASPKYDSGYATFGADFYNYVSNNAAEAGNGAQVAANNLREQNDLLKNVLGLSLLWAGLLSICYFGMHLEFPIRRPASASISLADLSTQEESNPEPCHSEQIKEE